MRLVWVLLWGKLPARGDRPPSEPHSTTGWVGTAASVRAVAPLRALTGLVVPVPEAEPVVGAHRLRLDEHAALGAPAHVTVLFPFLPADALDDAVLDRLGELFRGAPTFSYAFSGTAWFGDDVLWLAPDDPAPFRDLTARVHGAFPWFPPYAGAFGDDVVPHLTVGHRHPRPALAAAERAVAAHLPVTGSANGVVLLAQTGPDSRWSQRAVFPLGAVSPR